MAARGSTNFLDSLLVHLMSRWWTQGDVGGSAARQVIMWGMVRVGGERRWSSHRCWEDRSLYSSGEVYCTYVCMYEY